MANWSRWLRYGRAKVEDALRSGNDELDRREAALEADAADKPWLRSTGPAPTLDEVRARIEHETPPAAADGASATAPRPAAGAARDAQEGFDFAEQQRQADERLAAIRAELGLGGDGDPPAGDGGGAR